MVQELGDFDNLEKVKINNKLLSSMFFHTEGYDGEGINPLNGNGHYRGIARPYVSYLIQRLFNIHRFPCCIEAIARQDDRAIKSYFEDLSDTELSNHLSELERVYRHTQAQLSAISSKIRVRRGLRKSMSEIAACAVIHAKKNNLTQVQIPCNTFDFYALAPSGGFDDGVWFYRDIPVEDILLCHHTINGLHQVDSDVLVVNKSPRGIITIDLKDIHVSEKVTVSREAVELYESCIEHGTFEYTKAFKDFYLAFKYDSLKRVNTIYRDQNMLGRALHFLIERYGKKHSPRISREKLYSSQP
ncbi:hypothetical protein PCIT_a2417 [Pseudoalteromonas citrea]|uniref:Uncharacterized protein n=2 Tax=Pseudoalteromonas citrea TaxID=43655 RepID=A0AAD4FSK6_9GAMM|nr:hypothetical protein [Pseudoalteromonas citrea]KAF7772357.1 hypothetical protein PCIT_a2417 [Pseudoalteromonas citrea]